MLLAMQPAKPHRPKASERASDSQSGDFTAEGALMGHQYQKPSNALALSEEAPLVSSEEATNLWQSSFLFTKQHHKKIQMVPCIPGGVFPSASLFFFFS